MSVLSFSWLSMRAAPPARWDLRLLGWELVEPGRGAGKFAPISLLDGRPDSADVTKLGQLPLNSVVAVGVDAARERVEYLRQGLGDALSSQVALVELSERVLTVIERAHHLPRLRQAGPVALDLFHRDGRLKGRWIGLHPREFALFWRLAEAEGKRVPRQRLLADVWRVGHAIETNSLEVHVSRLRAKLATFECDHLIQTDPRGGYFLKDEAASDEAVLTLSEASAAEDSLIEQPQDAQQSLSAMEREHDHHRRE